MPNNANARREKSKKKKDRKRKTVPPPLHKEDKVSELDNASSEDKASADSSSLSLSLCLQVLPEHQRLRCHVLRAVISIWSMNSGLDSAGWNSVILSLVKKGLEGANKCERNTQEHQRKRSKPSTVLAFRKKRVKIEKEGARQKSSRKEQRG
jgi:hypothetical protein